MLPWLDPGVLAFPDPSDALDDNGGALNGLLAAGGDLSPARLLLAYHSGIFPWFDETQPILWWSPDPRYLLAPQDMKIRRSLAKVLRNRGFTVTFNTAFSAVMSGCAEREETWITEEMHRAYLDLHQAGWARSVETWLDGELVGGLYGVTMGRFFFGESMFSRATDASKVALATLARQLSDWGFAWIDCQVRTPHLQSLGAQAHPRSYFLHELRRHAGSRPQLHTPPAPWPTKPTFSWRVT